jgi:hypothetical protein
LIHDPLAESPLLDGLPNSLLSRINPFVHASANVWRLL